MNQQEFDEKHTELLEEMTKLSEFLLKHNEWPWASWLDKTRKYMHDERQRGLSYVLTGFEDKGTLNDLRLDPNTGHRVTQREVHQTNVQLKAMIGHVHSLAANLHRRFMSEGIE